MMKISKLDNREAVIAYFGLLLKVNHAYGYPVRKEETAFMYAERLGKRFALFNDTMYTRDFAEIFTKASYSQEPVTDTERETMKAAYLEMLDMLEFYRMAKPMFFIHKYILQTI